MVTRKTINGIPHRSCRDCGKMFPEKNTMVRCPECARIYQNDYNRRKNMAIYGTPNKPPDDDGRVKNAELKGLIPVKGLYSGCDEATKKALINGDIKALLRA